MQRLATGVPELDLILEGGLEPGSLVVLAGPPGTGKTILAQQICFANATPERKAVYYTTFAEPHSKLVPHLEAFEFFDRRALGTSVEFIHLGDLVRDQGGDGLGPVIAEVSRTCFADRPAVIVIDSARALRDFATEPQLRTAYYDLASRVAHTQAVLLMLGEYTPAEMQSAAELSLADGIIQLAYESREPLDRRWLRVAKMRGSHHLVGKHSFRIGAKGIEVSTRLETVEPPPPSEFDGRISSGVPGLDGLMGGGIAAGDATVILGPSGAGKTILGLSFISEGLAQDERCLYVSFQETSDQLLKKATLFGWDLAGARQSGRLVVYHVPLGDLDLDILGAAVRRELSDGSIRRVVVDSLAELVFAARESERFPAYARSLVGYMRAAGAALLVTSETTTLGPMTESAGGMSFLFHNVVLLRYIEMGSEVGRAINVVKMRNSDHEKGLFRYLIDAQGFRITDKLEGIAGVLGWSALRIQDRAP